MAKWRASVQHWLRWVQALQQFETACMQQYVRVVSPAIDAEAANEADDLFFKTINLMLMQHHCTVVMSEGASVFCVHWSAKMEKMAEVARLDFYKTPSRTKDAWATEHKNTLRARHGLGRPASTTARSTWKPSSRRTSAASSHVREVQKGSTFSKRMAEACVSRATCTIAAATCNRGSPSAAPSPASECGWQGGDASRTSGLPPPRV